MKCKGEFVFKTLSHRDGGTFKDANGNDVSYSPAYVLKVDEVSNNSINERRFKVDEKNTYLINLLKDLDAYTKIIIEFEVSIYNTRVSLNVANVYIDDTED